MTGGCTRIVRRLRLGKAFHPVVLRGRASSAGFGRASGAAPLCVRGLKTLSAVSLRRTIRVQPLRLDRDFRFFRCFVADEESLKENFRFVVGIRLLARPGTSDI